MKQKTKEEFLSQLKEKQPDSYSYYDYSEFKIEKGNLKSTIICPKHGRFEQRRSKHLRGQGCRKCSLGMKSSEEVFNFIKYNTTYLEDKVDLSSYKDQSTRVNLECICGRKTSTRVSKLFSSPRRLSCHFTKSQEQYISEVREVHGDSLDLSLVEYKGVLSKVTIGCPKHGLSQVNPRSLIKGSGCYRCAVIGNTHYNSTLAERRKKSWSKVPYHLYLLDYGEFYKIGVSKDVDKRRRVLSNHYKGGDLKIIHIFDLSKYESIMVESEILKLLEGRICNHEENFSGYTETFDLDKEEITDLICYIDFITGNSQQGGIASTVNSENA